MANTEPIETALDPSAPLPMTADGRARAPRPRFVRGFGPGLVSGASANDPTTVGSLAVVGAATGFSMAWLVVLLLPMLALIQAIAASVAAVSQMSLQQAIGRAYGRTPAAIACAAVVVVGLFTLAADIQACAAALTLLLGVQFYYFVIPIAGVAYWLLATKSYLRIERILASLTLVFLCYVASAVLARPDWGQVLRNIVVPHVDFSFTFLAGALALLGTTLTSYVYFWESIGVAEQHGAAAESRKFSADAALGMLIAGSSFLFILVASAATSGAHHKTIQTAVDAAIALRPLAGRFDQVLFGVGLLASAAIAIPVLAATNGYVISQTLGHPAGLGLKPVQAKGFYGAIFISLAIGAALALLPVPTMVLLYWASVVGGLATPVTLVFMLLVARNHGVMNGRPISFQMACAGWGVTLGVTVASLAFVISVIK